MSLEKLPLKAIVEISKLCWENQLDINSPYGDFSSNEEIVTDASAWTGQDVEALDVEFICLFMNQNSALLLSYFDGKSTFQDISSKLKIPKSKKFKVTYEVWGSATLTETYNTGWTSYNEDWIKDSMEEHRSNGSWNYYDGEYESNESDNFDPDDFDILDITEKGRTFKENTFSKLVLENTNDILDNVDRDTLIKLRNLSNKSLE